MITRRISIALRSAAAILFAGIAAGLIAPIDIASGADRPRQGYSTGSTYSNADHMRGRNAGPADRVRCAERRRRGPEYVAGVDASGQPVAPAEGPRLHDPSGLHPAPYFPIIRRMSAVPGVPRRAPIGEIVVDTTTGQTYFNGVPLDQADDPALDCVN